MLALAIALILGGYTVAYAGQANLAAGGGVSLASAITCAPRAITPAPDAPRGSPAASSPAPAAAPNFIPAPNLGAVPVPRLIPAPAPAPPPFGGIFIPQPAAAAPRGVGLGDELRAFVGTVAAGLRHALGR